MKASIAFAALAFVGFGAAPVLAQEGGAAADTPSQEAPADDAMSQQTPADQTETPVDPESVEATVDTTTEGVALTVVEASSFSEEDLAGGQLEDYTSWLADAEGRPVYLFTADTPGSHPGDEGDEAGAAEMACTDDCLEAWPPVYTQGEPSGATSVDQTLIGTTDHDGQMVVTYNGYPLYYFAQDEEGTAPQGHGVESFGGTWYLIDPTVPFPGYQ